MKSRSHDDATVESLRQDPELAAAYLNDVLVDGDLEELMITLRWVSSVGLDLHRRPGALMHLTSEHLKLT
jgi:DNA-binding phage protein